MNTDNTYEGDSSDLSPNLIPDEALLHRAQTKKTLSGSDIDYLREYYATFHGGNDVFQKIDTMVYKITNDFKEQREELIETFLADLELHITKYGIKDQCVNDYVTSLKKHNLTKVARQKLLYHLFVQAFHTMKGISVPGTYQFKGRNGAGFDIPFYTMNSYMLVQSNILDLLYRKKSKDFRAGFVYAYLEYTRRKRTEKSQDRSLGVLRNHYTERKRPVSEGYLHYRYFKKYRKYDKYLSGVHSNIVSDRIFKTTLNSIDKSFAVHEGVLLYDFDDIENSVKGETDLINYELVQYNVRLQAVDAEYLSARLMIFLDQFAGTDYLDEGTEFLLGIKCFEHFLGLYNLIEWYYRNHDYHNGNVSHFLQHPNFTPKQGIKLKNMHAILDHIQSKDIYSEIFAFLIEKNPPIYNNWRNSQGVLALY